MAEATCGEPAGAAGSGLGWLRPRTAAILVFSLALFLRGLYLGFGERVPVRFDSAAYQEAATDLASGGMTPLGAIILVSRGPVYPLFAGVVESLAGGHLSVLFWAQAILDSGTCVWVFLIALRFLRIPYAFLCGAAAGCSGGAVLLTGEIVAEALPSFLLWGGIALWLVGDESGGIPARRILLGGLSVSLALLARPTLFPSVPFLAAGLLAGTIDGSIRQRVGMATLAMAATVIPLLAWSLCIPFGFGGHGTVGAGGLRLFVHLVAHATSGEYAGWFPDDQSGIFHLWPSNLLTAGAARLLAVVRQVFVHLWHLDNPWGQWIPGGCTLALVIQRLTVVAGLPGIVLMVAGDRRAAVLVLFLASFGILGAKWTEPRHAVPFLPVLAIGSGCLVERCAEALRGNGRRGSAPVLLVGVTSASTMVLVAGSVLWNGDPSLSALVALLGGWWVSHALLARMTGPRPWTLSHGAATLLALGVLPLLVGASRAVEPWGGDLASVRLLRLDENTEAVEEMEFPRALAEEGVRDVELLLDLRTPAGATGLVVTVNGEDVDAARMAMPTFPNVAGSEDAAAILRAYRVFQSYRREDTRSDAQWWRLKLPPESWQTGMAMRVVVGFKGHPPEPIPSLGVSKSLGEGGVYIRGPSPHATVLGIHTSLFKWHVDGDWRIPEDMRLAGSRRRSLVHGPSGDAETPLGDAFGIRLLVRRNDGGVLFY